MNETKWSVAKREGIGVAEVERASGEVIQFGQQQADVRPHGVLKEWLDWALG